MVKVRSDKKGFFGLWYSADRKSENEEMWQKVFSVGGGVDFFFSDRPL